jgi:hypothetical protein
MSELGLKSLQRAYVAAGNAIHQSLPTVSGAVFIKACAGSLKHDGDGKQKHMTIIAIIKML